MSKKLIYHYSEFPKLKIYWQIYITKAPTVFHLIINKEKVYVINRKQIEIYL